MYLCMFAPVSVEMFVIHFICISRVIACLSLQFYYLFSDRFRRNTSNTVKISNCQVLCIQLGNFPARWKHRGNPEARGDEYKKQKNYLGNDDANFDDRKYV